MESVLERWTSALWAPLVPKPRHEAEVVGILLRECDDGALILDRQRTLVPNTFVIELPADSLRQLSSDSAQVTRHLATRVRRHAAEQGYTFAGPVSVDLASAQGGAHIGRYRIRSRITPVQGRGRGGSAPPPRH